MIDDHVWAGPAGEPRARRPTDLMLLVAAVVALGVVVQARPGGGSTGQAISALLIGWTFLHHVWWTVMVLASLAALAVIGLALIGRRWLLVREVVAAAVVGALVMFLLHHLFLGPSDALVEAVLPAGSDALPVVRLAVVATIFGVASPHVVRPLRYTGHVVEVVLALATVALGGTNPNGVFAALLVGWIAASAAHLAFGSPGGRPSLARVAAALASLDEHVTDLADAPLRRDGVAQYAAVSAGSVVIVKVFGRDAWSGQLVAAVWRFLTQRGPGANLSITRVQQAEHEALMSLVASRHGVTVPVPALVARRRHRRRRADVHRHRR